MTTKEKTDIIIEAAELAGYQYNRVENNKEYDGKEYPNEFTLQPQPNEILTFTDSENWQGSMRNELFWNLKHSYNEFSQNSQPVLNNQKEIVEYAKQIDEETYNKIESLLMSIPITEEEIADLKKPLLDDGFEYNGAELVYNEEKSQDNKICFTYYTGDNGELKEQDFFFNNWEEVNKESVVGFNVDKELLKIAENEAFRIMNAEIEREEFGEFGKDIINAIIQMNEEKFGNKITEQDIGFNSYDSYGDGFFAVCITETYLDSADEHSVRVEAEVNEEYNTYKLNVYMYGEYEAGKEYLVGEVEFDNAEELINAIQNLDVDSIVNEDLLHEAVMEDIDNWLESDEFIDDDFDLEDDFGDDDDNPEGISIISKLQNKADKVKEQPYIDNDIDIDDLDIN